MKKRSKIINLLMYKVYLGFMAMICLISTPNKANNTNIVGDIPSKYSAIIFDERYYNNPNIKIVNSYKITDLKIMLNIIDEIITYNNNDNTYDWDRNKYGMLIEWLLHNMAYNIGFLTESSVSVDFSSFEENFYSLGLNKD